jgi:hypothetical protein
LLKLSPIIFSIQAYIVTIYFILFVINTLLCQFACSSPISFLTNYKKYFSKISLKSPDWLTNQRQQYELVIFKNFSTIKSLPIAISPLEGFQKRTILLPAKYHYGK